MEQPIQTLPSTNPNARLRHTYVRKHNLHYSTEPDRILRCLPHTHYPHMVVQPHLNPTHQYTLIPPRNTHTDTSTHAYTHIPTVCHTSTVLSVINTLHLQLTTLPRLPKHNRASHTISHYTPNTPSTKPAPLSQHNSHP
eukprot:2297299-Rhodomonas_salina.1